MKRFAIALLAAGLAACAGGDPNNANPGSNNSTSSNANTGGCVDLDGDGFEARQAGCNQGTDCDDRSAQVNPSAAEVCGDRRDNNCDGVIDEGCMATMDCVDADGDKYGVGASCFGPDCDDANPAINPSAREICGNSIDEDCMNGDLVCPSNCIDADDDGYGAAGSTDCVDGQGMVLTAIDCDDTNAAINASANEVCDGVDNNCDGVEDECALPGQACTANGGTCQGGAGSECENADDCAGQFLTCDPSTSPKVCKVAEGGPCQAAANCVDGLACEGNVCVGNFCASNPCSGGAPYDVCDRPAGICVECPHFDADETVRDAACEGGQSCTPGGWCAYRDPICTDFSTDAFCDDRPFDTPVGIVGPAVLWWINWYMADCWLTAQPDGVKKMCSSFNVASDSPTIKESDASNAYIDGDLDAELLMDENDALHEIWGEGFFNLEQMDWKTDLTPGSMGQFCMWYQPGGFISNEKLVLDKCENFTP